MEEPTSLASTSRSPHTSLPPSSPTASLPGRSVLIGASPASAPTRATVSIRPRAHHRPSSSLSSSSSGQDTGLPLPRTLSGAARKAKRRQSSTSAAEGQAKDRLRANEPVEVVRKGKQRENDRRAVDSGVVYDPLDMLASLRPPLARVVGPSTVSQTPDNNMTPRGSGTPAPAVPSIALAAYPVALQPSLADLLKTVDLSAALLLVHTLQSQQQAPPPSRPPAELDDTMSELLPPANPPLLKKLSTRLRSNSKVVPDPSSSVHESISPDRTPTGSPLATPMKLPGNGYLPQSDFKRARAGSLMGSVGKDTQRRRSSSIMFGGVRRERSDSTTSIRSKERAIDPRATMGEGGREFEGDSFLCACPFRLLTDACHTYRANIASPSHVVPLDASASSKLRQVLFIAVPSPLRCSGQGYSAAKSPGCLSMAGLER